MKIIVIAALSILVPATALAQEKWEFGAVGGVGLVNNVTATGASGTATAGFAPGFTAGAFIGESLYKHFSGEIRYEFMQSDLRLSSGGQTAQFSGVAHAIHYDVVYHSNRGEAPVQVFAALGGGIKTFVGTGAESAVQPLSQYGYFTKTKTWKPMGTASVGVVCRLSSKVSLRMEVRDFGSAFPTAVLTPPPGVKYGSVLNEVVPMVSFVYSR